MNRTGNNTTGWARRLTALLVTACLVMAMALPVYAEVDLLPDAPDEVELLEDEPGTASGEDTVPPEQNAATPEPEQSAGPEQPAPTETPEPTAEPTPTPEPAATATATPVPTVTPTATPTATPEPTEQPQKMYAATSVDNVQAVSVQGGVPATYTLYFAVPSGWKDYKKVKIYAVDGKSKDNDHIYFLEMKEVDETKDHRKIYSVLLNHDDHYHNGGLNGLEFCGYKGDESGDENPTYTVTIAKVGFNINNPPWITFNPNDLNHYNSDGKCLDGYIGGNYYDGANGDGWDPKKWGPYTVGHKHFAGKEMAFENKTSETLTNVQAWFYEPDESGNLSKVGGPIPLNSIDSGNSIASGSTATFKIPNDYCSFVRFTEGDTVISEYYNFYNEEVTGENQKRFQYSEGQCYCYMYNGIKDATWGRPGATRIYYDATFSKMALNGDTGDFSIPKANNNNKETIYYRIKGDGVESESGTLVKDGTNENLYYIDIPQGYRSIIFSGEEINDDNATRQNGVSTEWLPIPTDDKNCFYADTNDDAVYTNGQRGGYWAPKDTPRAETWKNTGTKVVDIASDNFTEEANTKYVTSTLYDYYTDYELNGNNRDNYNSTYYTPGEKGGFASQRSWVVFRQFDSALSDYYSNCNAQYPIYTGHFQPTYSNWGIKFEEISAALNLWGFNSAFKNENRFMAINNSTINENNKGEYYDYAYQGLVESQTSTGDATGELLLKDTKENTKVAEPHFDEAFLSGTNSKKAKLGDVYKNVAFPFTKRQIFNDDTGVDYWYFDSQDTTLYLKQDSTTEQYFLKSSTENRERSRNLDSNSAQKTINKNGENVSSYGYFPFNETATEGRASTYNYGFGTKLQMDFTLTDDGKVETKKIVNGKTEKTSIKFFFSGDDDVWVFIDGKLALDVGGAHGKVSGLLEFGETDTTEGKKNSVTAYVSQVKEGGTSENDQDGKNGHSAVKSVRYNGENIDFYAKNTNLEPLDKGKKHTLTMYYMERGMWESNMAVAFNFPDNNELQVQKEVELSKVDPDFKNCFKDQKIFNFTIQNQATHYGEKVAAGSDTSGTKEVNFADCDEIKPATDSTEGEYIFKLDTNPEQGSGPEGEKVLHWYARYTDTEPVSAARKKRYGILTLKNPIDIKDERFLTFQVYVDPGDSGGDLSLNNLYLELLDENDVQKGSLGTSGINGATYGSVEVKTGAWVTVKLDLNKMKAQDGFNGKVKTIRVGDNYSRHIYFRNFTFIPKAVPKTMTGFTTDQKEIPDYGSATSGQLQNAINAQYTSTKDSDTQLVDDDGRFVLEDGETVTFSDQFRRGSYISLKEELNRNLYDTTWTVCENGQAVTSMKGDSESVTVTDTNKSLDKQEGSSPNDGRTEKIRPNDDQTGNNYTGTKPKGDTIVFRSYKDPDETSSTLTKLKVKYVNTVKTGGLKIQKKAAEGETLTGTYTFKVTFNDVGGEGLEEKPIERTVTIKGESTGTITGIPVGTRYIIEEVGSNDGAKLQSVTVPDSCKSAHVIKNNTMVEGVIEKSKDPNNPELTAIFTNTQRTLINIEFDKLWKDANGKDLTTENRPGTIYIQLQRRLATSQNDADWKPVNYPRADSPNYVTINRGTYGWLYTFSGLDQYQINTDKSQTDYVYRIVEGTVENDQFEQVAPGETITIKGNTYVVTAEATAKSEKDSETGATTTPATVTPDGTITGGSGKIVLTNKLQNPKFVLDIIKKDAERDENDKDVPLGGVEFKLEKLVETTTGGKTQWVVDKNYPFNSTNKGSITGTTGTDGKIISNPFTNLEPGTYRLTETKAHPGYNLLAQPIVIKFTQDGKCYIDGEEVKKEDKTFNKGANNTYTMTLTVLNRKTPELPHTGADAPSLWLLIGMPLAVAGLLIFTFRYNRKGGRRH
ncbi:MAG: LPXTG cell wall anchor domain-containing protein [Oscillospiraceae bacterium]|nr:LPXTG cell wall anchor domain-containing protein [Oscillospiraceae bacterium]